MLGLCHFLPSFFYLAMSHTFLMSQTFSKFLGGHTFYQNLNFPALYCRLQVFLTAMLAGAVLQSTLLFFRV